MINRLTSMAFSRWGIPLGLSLIIHTFVILFFFLLIRLLPEQELTPTPSSNRDSSNNTYTGSSNGSSSDVPDEDSDTFELLIDLSTLNHIINQSKEEEIKPPQTTEPEKSPEEQLPHLTEPNFTQSPTEASILAPEDANKISDKDSLAGSQNPETSNENKDLPNINQNFVGGIQSYKDQAESFTITPSIVANTSTSQDSNPSNNTGSLDGTEGQHSEDQEGIPDGLENKPSLSELINEAITSETNASKQPEENLLDVETGDIIPIQEEEEEEEEPSPILASKEQKKQSST